MQFTHPGDLGMVPKLKMCFEGAVKRVLARSIRRKDERKPLRRRLLLLLLLLMLVVGRFTPAIPPPGAAVPGPIHGRQQSLQPFNKLNDRMLIVPCPNFTRRQVIPSQSSKNVAGAACLSHHHPHHTSTRAREAVRVTTEPW